MGDVDGLKEITSRRKLRPSPYIPACGVISGRVTKAIDGLLA
jgi:hypothetical protein